jgi:hypothetical protein
LLVETLSEVYDNDEVLQQFLVTFNVMIRDTIDKIEKDIEDANDDELATLKSKKDSLEYLYDTVDNYLSEMFVDERSMYIAPNGKQYIVEYNKDRLAYTSPDFVYEKYLPTWELFVSHINLNNPGHNAAIDQSLETIIAPNNKVYYVIEENNKWTSNQLKSKQYFDTRSKLVEYIYENNSSNVWNHKIDKDFDEVLFTAPNGKNYKIFKTDST